MYWDKLTDLGIKLTRRSGNVKTKCPQCSDGRKNKTDTPLSVNITEGEFNCHNCGWKGNVRAYERKRENKKYEKPPQDVLKNIQNWLTTKPKRHVHFVVYWILNQHVHQLILVK